MLKLYKALAICCMLVFNVAARAENEYAPQGGDFAIELQFNPFSNNFKTFQIDQLAGRYMVNNRDALRFGIGFGIDSSNLTPYPDNSISSEYAETTIGNLSIDFGYERHFYSHGRIDIYAGVGFGYRYDSAFGKKNEEGYVKYHNISLAIDDDGDFVLGENRTSHSFRVNAFTGIDFYVYKGLYVGAELGIRLAYTAYPGYYIEVHDLREIKKYSEHDEFEQISLKTLCEPALRLGWKF